MRVIHLEYNRLITLENFVVYGIGFQNEAFDLHVCVVCLYQFYHLLLNHYLLGHRTTSISIQLATQW